MRKVRYHLRSFVSLCAHARTIRIVRYQLDTDECVVKDVVTLASGTSSSSNGGGAMMLKVATHLLGQFKYTANRLVHMIVHVQGHAPSTAKGDSDDDGDKV